ncbi:MAG: hypothetical protein JO316_04625 [Abitibacteriaceae bacterium]|nr:hypothetical protein [Abditibacteriaceae bacterium]
MHKRSTKDVTKKQREAYFLSQLKNVYAEFPQGQIEEGEEPDFLVHEDSVTVGIELVYFIRGQSKGGSVTRHYEVLYDQIVQASQELFEQANRTPLMVHIHWYRHHRPKKQEVETLATQMTHIVASNIPHEIYRT